MMEGYLFILTKGIFYYPGIDKLHSFGLFSSNIIIFAFVSLAKNQLVTKNNYFDCYDAKI